MRFWVCLFAILFGCLLVPAQAQEKDKKPGPVQISWHGQSFFTITSSQGDRHRHRSASDYRLWPDRSGSRPTSSRMSHNHNDHTQIKALRESSTTRSSRSFAASRAGGKQGEWNIVDETDQGRAHQDGRRLSRQHGRAQIRQEHGLHLRGRRLAHRPPGRPGPSAHADADPPDRPGGRADDPRRRHLHAQRRRGQAGRRAAQAEGIHLPDALRHQDRSWTCCPSTSFWTASRRSVLPYPTTT